MQIPIQMKFHNCHHTNKRAMTLILVNLSRFFCVHLMLKVFSSYSSINKNAVTMIKVHSNNADEKMRWFIKDQRC